MSVAKKSDPYDPKPVIQYAADKAVETGKDQYVASSGGAFRWTSKQPPTTQSHWRLDHGANLFAHIPEDGLETDQYNYILV